MKAFEKVLYEALLVSFGKILAKYNVFAQGSILRDVGREIMQYLNENGFEFEEIGDIDDLSRMTDFFVDNGFARKLEIEPADKGQNYIWHDLYGIDAYRELHEISDNPFLACPLNLCLFYIAEKHNKSMKLHTKSFTKGSQIAESQYELVDKEPLKPGEVDPLVVENVRLYELARERADRLEKAYKELKILRGIIPICASCKKIRDDQGYWQQVEGYISEHSEALFSHGICPNCMDELYPGFGGDESEHT